MATLPCLVDKRGQTKWKKLNLKTKLIYPNDIGGLSWPITHPRCRQCIVSSWMNTKKCWNESKKMKFTTEEVRDSLPNQWRPLGMFWEWISAAFPLVPGKNLQKPASKSLLEMLQNTQKVKKIFCFYTENFHMKSPSKK
jgi:hypothetical protein